MPADPAQIVAAIAAVAREGVDALARERDDALLLATMRGEELAVARADLAAALTRWDEHMAAEHPPQPPTTYIGACPIASRAGTAADVIAKWGPSALRTFQTEGPIKPGPRPEGVTHAHHSAKPPLGVPLTDDDVRTMHRNHVDGDCGTIWHETPVKFRNGSFSAAESDQALALMNDYHARVVRLREAGDIPQIRTVFVDAAWMWDTPNLYPGTVDDRRTCEFWLTRVDADLIGLDADAYANLTRYPDFTRLVPNVLDSLKRHPQFTGWTVPEFMHPRISSDPDGSQREEWATQMVQAFTAASPAPAAVLLFDTDHRPNQVFEPGSPEFAAWRDLIQTAQKEQP